MSKLSVLACLCLIVVSSAVIGQRRVLPPAKIGRLLPARVKGFYADADGKNSLIKIGTLRYSLAERSFAKGPKSFKILLFDYAEAPIMFNQAIRKWQQMKHVESDSLIYRPYVHPDSTSWESYSPMSGRSQIIMGVNKRFFLTLTGQKLSLEELHQILQLLPFERYPK